VIKEKSLDADNTGGNGGYRPPSRSVAEAMAQETKATAVKK